MHGQQLPFRNGRGFFKEMTAERSAEFSVSSAGLSALEDYPASEETVIVMKDHGIDVSGHRSRRLTAAMVRTADKIFVMEHYHRDFIVQRWPESAEKVHLLTELSSDENQKMREIDIPDPIRMPDDFYRNVFGIIRNCVQRIVLEVV